VVVGDLVIVTNIMTTGIKSGSIGIIKEKRKISEKDYIYFIHLILEDLSIPLWKNEFEVLKSGTGRSSRNS